MARRSAAILAESPFLKPWVLRAIDEERGNLYSFSLPSELLKNLSPYIEKIQADSALLLSEILPITLRQSLADALAEQTHEWLPGFLLRVFENDFLAVLKPEDTAHLRDILSTATQFFYPIEKSRTDNEEQDFQAWLARIADTVTPQIYDNIRRWIELKQLADEASLFLINQMDPNNAYHPDAAYPLLIHDVPDRDDRWRVLQGQMELTITGHPTNADDTIFLRIQSDLAEAVLSWLTKTDPVDIEKTRFRVRDEIARFVQRSPRTEKRTTDQEIDEMVWFCERVYYGLPGLLDEIYQSIELNDPRLYDRCRRALFPLTPIQLRSWISVDADGNTNVDNIATAHGIARSRDRIRSLYLTELATLIRLASHPWDIAVRGQLLAVEKKLQDAPADSIGAFYPCDVLIEDLGAIYRLAETPNIKTALRHLIYRVRTFSYHFAKLDTRQEPKIHSAIIARMLDRDVWQSLSDEQIPLPLNEDERAAWAAKLGKHDADPSAILTILDHIASWPEHILEQLLDEAETSFAATAVDKDPYLATIRRLKLYEAYTTVDDNGDMRRDQFDQYTISNCGEVWGMVADMRSVDILMRAAGIDRLMRIVPLIETRRALQSITASLTSLLQQNWFQKSLAHNDNLLRVQIALSDTMRAHGPGAYVEQIEAGVAIALAVLNHNKQNRTAPVQVSIYYGGAMLDTMRGGGDQTSLMFRLRRDVEAAALAGGFTAHDVHVALSLSLQQTRQGRDCYYLLGSPRRARQHLGITTSGVWHFLGYSYKEKTEHDRSGLLNERRSALNYREWCQPVLDRYERFFGPLLNHLAKNISPLFVYGVNAMNTSSRGERQAGLATETAFQATKVRAISGQIFFEKWGAYLPGWLGLSMLEYIPLHERQDAYEQSHIVREHLHRVNILLDKFDVSALWRELGQARPVDEAEHDSNVETFEKLIALTHAEQTQHIEKAVQNKAADVTLLRAGLSWLEREYHRVTALNAETLYGKFEAADSSTFNPTETLSYAPLIQEELNSMGAILRMLRCLRRQVDISDRDSDEKLLLEAACSRALHAGNRSGAFSANHNHGFGHSVAKSLKEISESPPFSTHRSWAYRYSLLAKSN